MKRLPSLCHIYRQDVVGFFPHSELEELRELSKGMNSAVVGLGLGGLPRRILPRLELKTVGAYMRRRCKFHSLSPTQFQYIGGCTIKKGFASGGRRELRAKSFQEIFEFRFCCKDIKPESNKIIGQLIFPFRLPTEVVVIRIQIKYGKHVAFRGQNQLTGDTALALLHFLSHLGREMAFGRFEVRLPPDGDWTINPAVLDALHIATNQRQFHLRAECMVPYDHSTAFSLETMRFSSQLVCPRVIQLGVNGRDRAEALRLVAAGRGLGSRAHLEYCDIPFVNGVLTVGSSHNGWHSKYLHFSYSSSPRKWPA